MKSLSKLEIKFIVQELQSLVGARVDKITHPSRKELMLELYRASIKKKLIRFEMPYTFYITSTKIAYSAQPTSLCLAIRKHLKNSRLTAILQHSSERVVELTFSSKNGVFRLIFELFSRGNIILCDASYLILATTEKQEWRTRKIAVKEQYRLPPQKLDIFKLSIPNLQKALSHSSMDSVVKVLAADLGIGGTYAEEICLLSSVNKLSEPGRLKLQCIKKIMASWRHLLRKKPRAVVVFKGGNIHDIAPFPLRLYAGLESKFFPSFNEALDYALTREALEEIESSRHIEKDKRISSLRRRIAIQEQMITNLSVSIGESTRKGELIYENYQQISRMLHDIKSKKFSFPQLQKKYGILKNIDAKTGKISVEIQ